MTYNEWITELKQNLLSVSDAEKRRVLDYYAEAYADRRAAGFSESEIIAGFGAPYDAAQAILESEQFADNNANNSIHIHNSEQKPPQSHYAPHPSPYAPPLPPAPKKKKKATTIIVGIIVSLLLLGVICYLITLGISCAIDPEFADAKYAQQSEDIQNIIIDFSVGEIETVFYDGDKIEIDYYTSNIYTVDISEKNGTLNYKLRNKWWILRWGTINYPKTIIKLPEGNVYNLNIDMSAGSAVINGGNYGDLKLDLSAGAVNLKGETICNSLYIDLSAGKVDVGKVECSNSLIINLSAGQLDIGEISCAYMKIDLSAGQLDIDEVVCPHIVIGLSAGTANLCVNGDKNEYFIRVDRSAGRCNLTDKDGTDPNKKIDIDISAGSVNVSFVN